MKLPNFTALLRFSKSRLLSGFRGFNSVEGVSSQRALDAEEALAWFLDPISSSGVCSPTRKERRKETLTCLFGIFPVFFQYNRPPTRPLIEKACSCFSGRQEGGGVSGHVNDDKNDDWLVESLAKLVKIMFEEMKTTCKDENMLALTDTALGESSAVCLTCRIVLIRCFVYLIANAWGEQESNLEFSVGLC